MKNEIKDTILTVVFIALCIVFFGSVIFAGLAPVGIPETKTALYIGLFSFLGCLAVCGLFND